MPRGQRITRRVKLLIVEESLRDDARRGEVVRRIKRGIKILKLGKVPKDGTLEKLVSRARKVGSKAQRGQQPRGDQWTLADAIKEQMSSEGILAVSRVWQLAKSYLGQDVPFTIREAKWVATLGALVRDTRNLRNWALEYSLRELTCDMTNSPLEIRDLDAAVLMGPWGFDTARQVGHVKPADFPAGLGWMYPEPPKPVADSTIKVVQAMEMILGKQLQPGKSHPDKLPPLDSANLSEEAVRVYALWLQYLSNGRRWKNLSIRKRRDIILRLRQWVKDSSEYVQSTDDSGKCRNMKPTELLKKVGHKA